MTKFIAIIGALDTKGDQVEYLKQSIEARGHRPIIIDVGILGNPTCKATITRQEVVRAAGSNLEELISFKDENKAIKKMAECACKIVRDLYEKAELDGVLAVGGSMGTSLALKVMDVLPLNLPKLILSTLAYSPAIDPDFLCNNVIMMQWIGGLWGINEFVKRVLDQAVAVITASAELYEKKTISEKRLLGITSLGMSAARYLYHLKPSLERKGYEIAVFHPTGMNTRMLERAIEEGLIHAVLDLRVGCELMGQITGSLFGACPGRLEAAAKRGIPQVVCPAGMEAILWAPYKKVPRGFANRIKFEHNPLLWVFSSTREEKVKVAKLMARKLNKAKGPTAVIIALKHSPMQVKYGIRDTEGLHAFRSVLKKNLKSHIKVVEVDSTYDDPEFAEVVIRLLDEMVGSQRYQQ